MVTVAAPAAEIRAEVSNTAKNPIFIAPSFLRGRADHHSMSRFETVREDSPNIWLTVAPHTATRIAFAAGCVRAWI